MKRIILGALFGVIGGTALGFALGIFLYPFWFLRDSAMERLANAEMRTEVSRGLFTHVNKLDPIHWGKGEVSIVVGRQRDAVVYLRDNFEVGPGPRFHVYLVDRAVVRSRSDFLSSRHVDLGRLRAFTGSQVYPVPDGTRLSEFGSVVIWCKEFNVLISPASLRTVVTMRDLDRAQEPLTEAAANPASKLSKP